MWGSLCALVVLKLLVRLGPITGGVSLPTPALFVVSESIRLGMTFTVTILVLAASLYIILTKKYADADKKWAYGAIGTILGYWLGSR